MKYETKFDLEQEVIIPYFILYQPRKDISCDLCNGIGTLQGYTCPKCEGRGYICEVEPKYYKQFFATYKVKEIVLSPFGNRYYCIKVYKENERSFCAPSDLTMSESVLETIQNKDCIMTEAILRELRYTDDDGYCSAMNGGMGNGSPQHFWRKEVERVLNKEIKIIKE